MKVTIEADWQRPWEGDSSGFQALNIASLHGEVEGYGERWRWEVTTGVRVGSSFVGGGWADSEDEAKAAAEARIRKIMERTPVR